MKYSYDSLILFKILVCVIILHESIQNIWKFENLKKV